MGKMEAVIRSEILRLTRKELRAVVVPLAREVRALKRRVSELRKAVTAYGRVAGEVAEKVRSDRAVLRVPEAEAKAARLSSGLIRKLRKRLGLSQGDLALLAGVSSMAVWSWESGRTRPTKQNRAVLVALRKLGRRDVKRLLAQKAEAAPPAKPAPSARKRRKKRSARK